MYLLWPTAGYMLLPILALLIHVLAELPVGAITYSRYAMLAVGRMLHVLLVTEILWVSVLASHPHSGCMDVPGVTASCVLLGTAMVSQ